MKLNRLWVLSAAWLSLTGPARAQNESLASIFTNAPHSAAARGTVVPRRSSILFIACHGLSFGDLSCYGQTNFQTPNLDRLAAEGMRFTDYQAAGDDLTAAQAALVEGNLSARTIGHVTLASRLQAVGYRTGLIGEWTGGPNFGAQGFEIFAGFLGEQEADDYYSDFIWRYTANTINPNARPDAPAATPHRVEITENDGHQKATFMPDLLIDSAANFIRLSAPDRSNHYRPFFLLLNLPLPHTVVAGKDEYPVPTDAPFTDEKWPQAAKNRAALVTRLDASVGKLLQQLGSCGMTNNVAVFLAGAVAPEKYADPAMNFLKLKGEVRGGDSPERLRVPMIVHWPEHVAAGQVNQAQWTEADFAPTALEIGYAKTAPDFTGTSMMPALAGARP